MTIPFLDLFKKLSSRFSHGAPQTDVRTQPIAPVVRPLLEIVEELPETNRGSGGFGSTGRF